MTAPLHTLRSVTGMAVRTQAKCINCAGTEAYDRWSDLLFVFMNDPQFNMAEFNRLCRLYKLD